MDEVARIREKTDLIALISEFIPLKKTGRNFKANCPFHNEQTPSFVVSPERQIWHCFGCGKGGDAFTFLMEYENLEFVEALRILAKKTGIELSESDFVKKDTLPRMEIHSQNIFLRRKSIKTRNFSKQEFRLCEMAECLIFSETA